MYDPDDQRDPPEPDDDFAEQFQKGLTNEWIEYGAGMLVIFVIMFILACLLI